VCVSGHGGCDWDIDGKSVKGTNESVLISETLGSTPSPAFSKHLCFLLGGVMGQY
jgi:hypothetical protein